MDKSNLLDAFTYGLLPQEMAQINQMLALHANVEKALLYGSRAKGNYHPGSDIDLTLCGEQLALADQFDIENKLDDLLLPYKIDLSIFCKIENSDLIDHINRVGRLFYQKEENQNASRQSRKC